MAAGEGPLSGESAPRSLGGNEEQQADILMEKMRDLDDRSARRTRKNTKLYAGLMQVEMSDKYLQFEQNESKNDTLMMNRHSPFYIKAVEQGKNIQSNRNEILKMQSAALQQDQADSIRGSALPALQASTISGDQARAQMGYDRPPNERQTSMNSAADGRFGTANYNAEAAPFGQLRQGNTYDREKDHLPGKR